MRKEYVYFIEDGEEIKIGRSYDPKKRLFQIKLDKTKNIKILHSIEMSSIEESMNLEKSLHIKFSRLRTHGEWFKKDTSILNAIAECKNEEK